MAVRKTCSLCFLEYFNFRHLFNNIPESRMFSSSGHFMWCLIKMIYHCNVIIYIYIYYNKIEITCSLEQELRHSLQVLWFLHMDNKEQLEQLKIDFINKAEKLIAETKDLQVERLSEVGYKYNIA